MIFFDIGCILCGGIVQVEIGLVFEGSFNCDDEIFSANPNCNNVVGKDVGRGMEMTCG